MSEAAHRPDDVATASAGSDQRRRGIRFVYRHSWLVRITHWINVACIVVLLMSGLQIFNAHPALYWGNASTFDAPALSMSARRSDGAPTRGITTIGDRQFDTTGWLGYSTDNKGIGASRAFPAWATLPSRQSLTDGRLWHFFFAWLFVINGLAYLTFGLLNRHLWRDMTPSWRELRGIGGTVWDHMRLRFAQHDGSSGYNVLQKLSYLAIVLVVLPVLILAGLAMSPRLNAGFPELLTLFGGRQSARTIHFIAAFTVVGFVIVHVVMVLISGAWNNIRSMLTGRYAVERRVGSDGGA